LEPSRASWRISRPRFVGAGLRDLVGVYDRPQMARAQAVGLSHQNCADGLQFRARRLDLIKDDYGLADQSFTPFKERVERCAEAVARANAETGLNCRYFASVTTRVDRVIEYAHFARSVGAGGVLICPGLTGFDLMRVLADDHSRRADHVAPLIWRQQRPQFGSGIAHGVLYGHFSGWRART